MIHLETIVMEVYQDFICFDTDHDYEIHFRWRFWDDETNNESIKDFYVWGQEIEEWINWVWAYASEFIEKEEEV